MTEFELESLFVMNCTKRRNSCAGERHAVCCAGGFPVFPHVKGIIFADSPDDAFIGCKGYPLPMMKKDESGESAMNPDQFLFPFCPVLGSRFGYVLSMRKPDSSTRILLSDGRKGRTAFDSDLQNKDSKAR